ncbi:hypothetical protein KC361_g33 [Hortaea werneckii]|nr:hypothetical protein KC361_g33 [Hortaea werneckii]
MASSHMSAVKKTRRYLGSARGADVKGRVCATFGSRQHQFASFQKSSLGVLRASSPKTSLEASQNRGPLYDRVLTMIGDKLPTSRVGTARQTTLVLRYGPLV